MKSNIIYTGNTIFKTKIRGHEIVMDLSEKLGGDNTAPTPTEFFMASLGSCAGLFAVRYLQTAKLNPEGLSIDLDWKFDRNKTRIERIQISVSVPNATLGRRKKALLMVVRKCIIHNTLKNYPDTEFVVNGK